MTFDNELVAGKLVRWGAYLDKYHLPQWRDIPNIGLYMEQVTALLRDYLDYLPPELKEEQFITPATINNYVRKKFMPEPVKKKYYRIHIAYLIMICTMKHCISIPTLQTMLPSDLAEEEMQQVYTSYAARHRCACRFFVDAVRTACAPILGDADKNTVLSTDSTVELITQTAVLSGLSRLLAEKLLLLDGKTLADGGDISPRV